MSGLVPNKHLEDMIYSLGHHNVSFMVFSYIFDLFFIYIYIKNHSSCDLDIPLTPNRRVRPYRVTLAPTHFSGASNTGRAPTWRRPANQKVQGHPAGRLERTHRDDMCPGSASASTHHHSDCDCHILRV